MGFIETKKITYFSSIYGFFLSHITKNEITKVIKKFNIDLEIKKFDKDEYCDIAEKLIDYGITDEDIIKFVLKNRKNNYLLNYNNVTEQFEMIEII